MVCQISGFGYRKESVWLYGCSTCQVRRVRTCDMSRPASSFRFCGGARPPQQQTRSNTTRHGRRPLAAGRRVWINGANRHSSPVCVCVVGLSYKLLQVARQQKQRYATRERDYFSPVQCLSNLVSVDVPGEPRLPSLIDRPPRGACRRRAKGGEEEEETTMRRRRPHRWRRGG